MIIGSLEHVNEMKNPFGIVSINDYIAWIFGIENGFNFMSDFLLLNFPADYKSVELNQ
jgi:hypothetical protein